MVHLNYVSGLLLLLVPSWCCSMCCVFPYECVADIDLATITDRMAVKKAVQCGNVEDAIEKVNDLNPEVRCHFFL